MRRIPDIIRGIILYALLAIVASLALFVASQYIPSPHPAPVAQAAPAPRIVLPDPVEPYTPAPTEHKASFAVKVFNPDDTWGSGSHIGGGLVLTNAHVIRGQTETTVIDDDASSHIAEILWSNESRDVALLLIENSQTLSSVEIDCREPKEGEIITAFGSPDMLDFVSFQGRIAGKARTIMKKRSVNPVDLRLVPGMSGGGSVDSEGKLVGMNVMYGKEYLQSTPVSAPTPTMSGIGYIIPASVICPLLGRSS